MKLSACWIAKNEEGNIGRSIKSLKDAVDDMIVVDTGSTDNTKKEAEEAGARVFDFEWINDFSAAKNFALDKAEPGIVIFLDSDEYFYPALTDAERGRILAGFERHRDVNVASVNREDIQTSDGSIIQRGESNRILRHDGHTRFRSAIHEEMSYDGGKPTVMLLDLLIKHTGYSSEVIDRKLQRNAKMLEDSLLDAKDDTYEEFSHRVYMVRETQLTDRAKSFANLKIAIPQTGNWEYGISRYKQNYLQHLMRAMQVSAENRDYLNRKYVYDKLFTLFKKNYSDYILGAITDLLYVYWFDNREDLFLERFEADMEKALNNAKPSEYNDENSILKGLYLHAATLYSKRGDHKNAEKWAKKAFDTTMFGNTRGILIDILIDAWISGDPVQFISELSALYPSNYFNDRRFVISRLIRDDARQVYSYMLKQYVASGRGSLDDKLYSALLAEGPQAALNEAGKAVSQNIEGAADSIGIILFMIAIAYNADSIYESNKKGLQPYARILDAYFAGETLKEPTPDELNVLGTLFPFIAMLGGKAPANRLMDVFAEQYRFAYMVKAQYYNVSRNYAEVINTPVDGIDESDWDARSKRIRALIYAKDYKQALAELKPFIFTTLTASMAETLLLIAELGDGDAKTEAKALYDDYITVFEDCVDLCDIRNTGIIAGKKNVRAAKELAAMKPAELKSKLDKADKTRSYAQKNELLADVLSYYEAQNDLERYTDGLIELISADVDAGNNKKRLKEVFEKLGNKEAAAVV